MPKLKSHKTVEQIAKKHRLDVSFIQKQLDMGEPIEHEHTKDHELAMDIALQHLDEIPDYYTRLKKMEADAKKHHKKFKDVKEEDEFDMDVPMHSVHLEYDKRYCPKCKKVELRSECKYGPICWDIYSIPSKLKEETKSGDEGLHDWFNKSKSSNGKKGWVQLGGKWAGKPCARQPGQTSTPKCGSSKMSANLSPEEEERARARKNRQDPNQPQKTGGAKPTNVRTEEMDLQEVKDKPSKGSGKKDACYNKVKSRYDVWPSAYASGALVKCRKVGAANWGTKSESTMHNHEEERYCPLCDKRETRSECSYGGKAWDKVSVKDEEYSMVRSELETLMNAAERLKAKVGKGEGNLEAWVQSKITKAADYLDTAADYVVSGEMEESCWSGYKQIGMKKKGKKAVPNCVPEETIEDLNGETFAEVVDIIKPEPIKGFKSQMSESTRIQAQTGNVVAVTLSWRGKYYSLKIFFPQAKIPTRKEINDELQKVYPGCNLVYHYVSELQSGQPLIQSGSFAKPGPNKNYVKPMGEEVEINEGMTLKDYKRKRSALKQKEKRAADKTAPGRRAGIHADKASPERAARHRANVDPDFDGNDERNYPGGKLNPKKVRKAKALGELGEDWQKVNRQDKTDGLSQKAVNAYRRENPGSKLQTAVTEKKPTGKRADRRKSFCSRMTGMKKRLTSTETARDPDSRINKALRRWNCN
jgi:hypothetical protein